MIDISKIGTELLNTSLIEWVAVICSMAYVILIARKRIIAWLFALIASCIYVYLCIISQYYLESFLQIFYVLMAIYGWYSWNRAEQHDEFIKRWSLKAHGINIVLSTVITLILGYIFDQYTDQSLPYLDAFTTVFSIAATFMVAHRILENWIYWIVIDLLSIQLYANKDLNATAVLFIIYSIIAIVGFFQWRNLYKNQSL